MIYRQSTIHPRKWDFKIRTGYLISVRRPDLVIVNKKKRTCWIVNFVLPADQRIKLKDSEKRDKYVDLAREQKTLWNMKVTVISNVIDALSTVTKGLVHGPENLGKKSTSGDHPDYSIKIDQNTERLLETWGNLLSFKLLWRTIS